MSQSAAVRSDVTCISDRGGGSHQCFAVVSSSWCEKSPPLERINVGDAVKLGLLQLISEVMIAPSVDVLLDR